MHTTRRRPRVACVLAVVLALTATAVPSYAAAVAVRDEAGLRAAVTNNSVSEVVVTADVSLTAGHLTVPPGRVLTLRGACGITNSSSCTLDANYLSRHLHVTPGAEVYVSNLRLVNGSAVSQACGPFTQTYVPGSAAACVPQYYGYGVEIGLLRRLTGLTELLNNPAIGDKVSEASLPVHFLSNQPRASARRTAGTRRGLRLPPSLADAPATRTCR